MTTIGRVFGSRSTRTWAAVCLILVASISASAQNDNAAWDPRFDANGFSNDVRGIAIAPNGHVFVGGAFTTTAGGTAVNRVAEWDGASWSPLGTGVTDIVNAIAVDSNNNVYVVGLFTTAGGVTANRVAKWNGSSWSALGVNGLTNGDAYAIAVDGDDNVYVGGNFTTAGGTTALRVAMWDGSSWSDLDVGINNNDVFALATAPNGDIYAGGNFTVAGGTAALRVAMWDGVEWSALGGGINDSEVFALAVTTNGDVYAGGTFTNAGGVVAGRVARWNGSAWSDLNGGVTGDVFALAANGNDVYAGGSFTVTGDGDALRIAEWSGGIWSKLGDGVNDNVLAVASRGNDVYVGGIFTLAGGKPSLRFGRNNPDIVPVLIQSFEAVPAGDRVELAWQTIADEPVDGFRIYRRTGGTTGFATVGGGLIPPTAQSYSDTDVHPGETYYYRLTAVAADGSETSSREVEARVPGTSIELDQNFPNPFNPITTISFSAPEGERLLLAVYDLNGRLVATLFDGRAQGGRHEIRWNGRDAGGEAVGSGIYFYRLRAGKRVISRKMLLLK